METTFERIGVYREKVAYHSGELPFYVAGARLSWYPTMGHPCHYHEDVEFLYVEEGHMTYFINGKLCRIEEGEGIFVNSGHLHYGFSQDGTDSKFFCVLLNPMLLAVTPFFEREYLNPLTENQDLPYTLLTPGVPWQGEVLELLKKIHASYADQEPGFALEVQSCFNLIWQRLFCNMPAPDRSRGGDPKLNILRSMIRFLQENSTEKLTLGDIAAAGHVSESSCCRLFQKYLNRSPMVFLNECRLDEACKLLRETELSVTEVASRTGFNGASYFTEQFRKKYGYTPTQFRERCKR